MFLGGGRSRPLTPLTPLACCSLTAAALQRCWRRFTVLRLNRVSVMKLAFCKLATCLADSTVQQWRRLTLRCGEAAQLLHFILFSGCVMPRPAAPRKFRKAQPPTNFFHNALTVPFDCGSRPAGHLHLRSALAPSHPLHIVTHSFIFCVHAIAGSRSRLRLPPPAQQQQPKQPPASRRMRLLLPSPAHLCSATIPPTFASLHCRRCCCRCRRPGVALE